jgi:hypothetical protein
MKKIYKDSGYGYRDVAVLVSCGYDAGWTSWGMPEEALFDPIIVDFVENDKTGTAEFDEYIENTYNECVYCGGAGDLTVVWVPEGKEFRIDECDGVENLILKSDEYWTIA